MILITKSEGLVVSLIDAVYLPRDGFLEGVSFLNPACNNITTSSSHRSIRAQNSAYKAKSELDHWLVSYLNN